MQPANEPNAYSPGDGMRQIPDPVDGLPDGTTLMTFKSGFDLIDGVDIQLMQSIIERTYTDAILLGFRRYFARRANAWFNQRKALFSRIETKGPIKMAGKYFDQWTVGDRLTHQPGRTVTETDNLLFSAMTHNMQPLHLDAEFAGKSEFGRMLVNSTFTFSLAVGLSIADTTLGTLVTRILVSIRSRRLSRFSSEIRSPAIRK